MEMGFRNRPDILLNQATQPLHIEDLLTGEILKSTLELRDQVELTVKLQSNKWPLRAEMLAALEGKTDGGAQ